jgi:hypothetical protein
MEYLNTFEEQNIHSRLDSRSNNRGKLQHSVIVPTDLLGEEKWKLWGIAMGLRKAVLVWNKYSALYFVRYKPVHNRGCLDFLYQYVNNFKYFPGRGGRANASLEL